MHPSSSPSDLRFKIERQHYCLDLSLILCYPPFSPLFILPMVKNKTRARWRMSFPTVIVLPFSVNWSWSRWRSESPTAARFFILVFISTEPGRHQRENIDVLLAQYVPLSKKQQIVTIINNYLFVHAQPNFISLMFVCVQPPRKVKLLDRWHLYDYTIRSNILVTFSSESMHHVNTRMKQKKNQWKRFFLFCKKIERVLISEPNVWRSAHTLRTDHRTKTQKNNTVINSYSDY